LSIKGRMPIEDIRDLETSLMHRGMYAQGTGLVFKIGNMSTWGIDSGDFWVFPNPLEWRPINRWGSGGKQWGEYTMKGLMIYKG